MAETYCSLCFPITAAFVGVPTSVNASQHGSLIYTVHLTTALKGLDLVQNISVTVLIWDTLDEGKQCHCPSIALGSDYLFVWRQEDDLTIFKISHGFVGVWTHNPANFNAVCLGVS